MESVTIKVDLHRNKHAMHLIRLFIMALDIKERTLIKMVFDALYDCYEERILDELENTLTESEVDEMLETGVVHDMILKKLAKALSVTIYRNGKIEDIHAGEYDGPCDFKGIPDSCMKEINIDVCNKMYTMLKLLLSTDTDDYKLAYINLMFGEMCASDWYDPVIDESLTSEMLLNQ